VPADAQPQRTYGLVVGIDRYDLGPGYALRGPAAGACRFVHWLHRQRGVPASQIFLFLTPAPLPADGAAPAPAAPDSPPPIPEGVAVRDATHHLHDFVTDKLAGLRGELLLVYWCGHGIITADGARRLFYADARPGYERNLDLAGLLAYLRSNQVPGFRQQVAIVDACADYVGALARGTDLARHSLPFPPGEFSDQHKQFVLLAARAGESARNLPEKGTGLFSREVMELLAAEPAGVWPPDMPRVYQQLNERFRALRDLGEARQTPTYFFHRTWEGSEGADGYPHLTPDLEPLLRAYLVAERQAILSRVPFRPPGLADEAADPAALDLGASSVALRVVPRSAALPFLGSAPGEPTSPAPPRAAERLAPGGEERARAFDDVHKEWQESGRAIVVLGDPGYGKSWLVARLAWEMLADLAEGLGSRPPTAGTLPVRVTCRELGRQFAREPDSRLPGAVAALLARRLANSPDPQLAEAFREFVTEQFERQAVCLLADGWDESEPADRDRLQQELSGWVALAGRSRLLLTSRPAGYSGNVLPGAPEWVLLPLDKDEGVEQFVTTWFGEGGEAGRLLATLRRRPQLLQSARVPLFGAVVCWMWQSGEFPESAEQRTALVESCLRLLLRRAGQRASETTAEEIDALLNAVAELAYRTFRGGRWVIEAAQLQWAVEEAGRRWLGRPPAEVQGLLTGKFGLFTPLDEGRWEIVHQSFGEFLCALGVALNFSEPSRDFAGWLRVCGGLRFLDPRWREVWCHLAAKLPRERAAELLDTLAAVHRHSRPWRPRRPGALRDDLFDTALLLGAHCLAAAKATWETAAGRRLAATLLSEWRTVFSSCPAPIAPCFWELSNAVAALARAGHPLPLSRYLNDPDFETRYHTAFLVRQVGPLAAAADPEVVPALKHAVARRHRRFRPPWKAAYFGAICLLISASLLPLTALTFLATALILTLSDKHDLNTWLYVLIWWVALPAAAGWLLVRRGHRLMDPILDPLARRAMSDEYVRDEAARALAAVDPAAAVPVLCEALRDADARLRRVAADELGDLGPAAATAAGPALYERLSDGDAAVRKMVVQVLGRWGPAAAPSPGLAVASLAGRLNDVAEVREATATALGQPSWGPLAVPALVGLLAGDSPDLRVRAAVVLRQIGRPAAQALPELTRNVTHTDPDVRRTAVEALGAVGTADEAALAALTGAAGHADPVLRAAALTALGKCAASTAPGAGPVSREPVVAVVLGGLADASDSVRQAALVALGDLGPAAGDAVPALVCLAVGPAREARDVAIEALGKIRTPQAVAALYDLLRAPPTDDPAPEGPSTAPPHVPSAGIFRPLKSLPEIEDELRQKGIDVFRAKVARALGEVAPKDFPPPPDLADDIERARTEALRYMVLSWVLMREEVSAFRKQWEGLMNESPEERLRRIHQGEVESALRLLERHGLDAIPALVRLLFKKPLYSPLLGLALQEYATRERLVIFRDGQSVALGNQAGPLADPVDSRLGLRLFPAFRPRGSTVFQVLVAAGAAGVVLLVSPTARLVVGGILRNEGCHLLLPTGYWIERMHGDDPQDRRYVLWVLEGIAAKKDRQAIEPLGEALGDADDDVQWAAVKAFTRLGRPGGPRLLRALRDSSLRRRQGALTAFHLMAKEDMLMAAGLVAALDDESLMMAAFWSLGQLPREDLVDLMRVLLTSDDVGWRRGAAVGLGNFGKGSPSTVAPALVKATKDPDARVREYALTALTRLGDAVLQSAIAPLIAALDDDEERVSETAESLLKQLGGDGADLAAALREAQRSGSPRASAAASRILKLIHPVD
jgi:HEAT repeat protein